MKRLLVLAIAFFASAVVGHAASPWPSSCIQPISAGQSINGVLTTSDCSFYFGTDSANKYYTDVYSFSGTAGQQIAITMNSTAVDAWLDLYNVNDVAADALIYNDDGGGGTNARIPAGTGYFTLPATGTYYIWANTAIPNQTGPYTITLTVSGGGGIPTPPIALPSGEVTVHEFYHPIFDHYFITAYQDEAANLAAGKLPPWVPTGRTFKVWTGPGANIGNVWRFFSASFAPKSGHFYTNNAAEAQTLRNGNVWTLEASDAFYMMASPTGTCPAKTIALYRLYNNGQGGSPNHRYTIDPAVRATMIAAHWVPEGNGPDGVFACVPLSTSLPPPTGSPFQQDVMHYTNTVLGFASGNIANMDQISLILSAALESLLNSGGTCPVATSVPPLTNLDVIPPTLTITFDFGNGCTVTDEGLHATVAGKGVITLTNIVVTDTALSGNVAIALTNVKVNGVLVANGNVSATFNITLGNAGGNPSYAGTVNITLTNFQLPDGLGFSGTIGINLNSVGTTTITTNVTSSPNNVTIKLNGVTVAPQSDGSVLINTTAASTVGAYAITISNLKVDADVCQTGALAGSMSYTKGGQTGTVTFNSTCNYTYTGP